MTTPTGNLGFVTALISLGASLYAGKKAKKDAKKAAAYQESMAAIEEGRAVPAPSVMTPQDIETLRKNWGRLRTVNQFALMPWERFGVTLSAPAKAALAPIWSAVKGAAAFSDVNWNYHAVPVEKVAAVMPLPELGAPQILPPVQAPQYTAPQFSSPQYQAASLLPAGLSTETVVIAAALGAVGLLIASGRR